MSLHQTILSSHYMRQNNSQSLIVCHVLCRYVESLLGPLTAFGLFCFAFPPETALRLLERDLSSPKLR